MVNNNKFIQNCLINSVVLVLSTLLYCERKLFFFLNEQNGQIGPIVTLSKLGKHVVSWPPDQVHMASCRTRVWLVAEEREGRLGQHLPAELAKLSC